MKLGKNVLIIVKWLLRKQSRKLSQQLVSFSRKRTQETGNLESLRDWPQRHTSGLWKDLCRSVRPVLLLYAPTPIQGNHLFLTPGARAFNSNLFCNSYRNLKGELFLLLTFPCQKKQQHRCLILAVLTKQNKQKRNVKVSNPLLLGNFYNETSKQWNKQTFETHFKGEKWDAKRKNLRYPMLHKRTWK